MKRACLLITTLTVVFALSAPTRAGPRRFSVDPVRDGVAIVGVTALAAALRAEVRAFEGQSPCEGASEALPGLTGPCDPATIAWFDRWGTDVYWAPARGLSDIGLTALIAGPFALSGASTLVSGDSIERFGEDALVSAQTLALVALVTQILKQAVRRPRPLAYSARFQLVERHAATARLSFPSGHTSLAFAGASVMTVILANRYPGDPGVVAGSAAAYAVATAVGLFRILGTKHFISDVLVGAFLGTALGLAVPLLHRESPEDRSPRQDGGARMVTLGFGF